MGILTSREQGGVEEVDIGINHAYRYPPKSGNYFSSHFIMGGERFETTQPETYLFGENSDLNFLGSRPLPFPYPAPSANEPSRTLKALINVRKESLRFVRVPEDSFGPKEQENRTSHAFNIEFTFDCDVRCSITIMYFCTEEVTNGGLVYTPRDPSMNSETYHYKKGANQQFSQVSHIFDCSLHNEEDLTYGFDKEVMPVVIYCQAEEGEEPLQSHATIAVIEKHSDGYVLKALKQKLFVDGLSYLLQEIYGIENKNAEKIVGDEDPEDNGAECVICMCDLRDTLILPCRHLCLCNCCADSLRYQANNCPICRAPFRALLQIKALHKTGSVASPGQVAAESGDQVPPGYESVSLIEALNGPLATPSQLVAPPYQDMPFQDVRRTRAGTVEDSTTQTDRPASADVSNEMRMSRLLAKDAEDYIETEPLGEAVPPPNTPHPGGRRRSSRKSPRPKCHHYGSTDSVKVVNEVDKESDEAEARSLLNEFTPEEPTGCMPLATYTPVGELELPQAEGDTDAEEETPAGEQAAVKAVLQHSSSVDPEMETALNDEPRNPLRKTQSFKGVPSAHCMLLDEGLSSASQVNSSPISRSSEASMSSASSTRALILHSQEVGQGSVA